MPTTDKFDYQDKTYTAKEKSFALVEVGDSKQKTAFYPQTKIMRWDNEVNCSFRLIHQESEPTVELKDDKVQWVGKDVEAHFYQIGEGKEDNGGFEFETILIKQPPTPRTSFTLQTKGLDFFHQPEFSPEEIAQGCERPENIIDSFAVYHQTMAGDYTAFKDIPLKKGEFFLPTWCGKNYKAGKFGHIMRPKLVDAQGWEVWGKPVLDRINGLYHVDMPPEFWAKAVYPVRHAAGLEFGYHTVGGTDDAPITYTVYTVCPSTSLPAANGVLTTIYVYGDSWGGNNLMAGLYSNSSSLPNARLGVNLTGIPISSFAWYGVPVTCNIVSGATYWFGWYPDADHFNLKFDAIVGQGAENWPNRSLPDPAAIRVSLNRRYSAYGEYTPAASGHPAVKRRGGIPYMALNRGVW